METLHQKIQNSPFKNVYWFARYLLNTDQYGALGRSKEVQLLKIVSSLELLLSNPNLNDLEKFTVLKKTLISEISSLARPCTRSSEYINNFVSLMDEEINTIEDIVVFCITMKYVVSPINRALQTIPSNDIDFCHTAAINILDTLGEQYVGKVISTWDTLGVKGCLDAERSAVVSEYSKMLLNLSSVNIEHTALDDNIMSTAFVQEFERRLGQKRKSRGGHSLEDVIDFLFRYYKFQSTTAPSHFNQDLEVDKWFKCSRGWSIGISCKRTLRERWKQLSQADRGTLSHFKIKELWHILTFDKDLSDDKIVRLGEQGQIFYLMDSSEKYKYCKAHQGMSSYVRPLSQLISDIRNNIN